MKKILTLMLAFALCLGMTACGEKDDSGASGQDASNDNKKIEKSANAVAGELGLTGGEDTMYQMIGAKEGKQFNDGSVELYLFDEDSDEYNLRSLIFNNHKRYMIKERPPGYLTF